MNWKISVRETTSYEFCKCVCCVRVCVCSESACDDNVSLHLLRVTFFCLRFCVISYCTNIIFLFLCAAQHVCSKVIDPLFEFDSRKKLRLLLCLPVTTFFYILLLSKYFISYWYNRSRVIIEILKPAKKTLEDLVISAMASFGA